MAGKFAAKAEATVVDISRLFNRSIRAALIAGLVTATRSTKHDSSNAAVHWMLAAEDGSKSRPWQRVTGRIRDFRGTRGNSKDAARAPVSPVGYRRDQGRNKARAIKFVRERELKEVIEKLVQGRSANGKFYFYHPLAAGIAGEDDVDLEQYAHNANIAEAGASAVSTVQQVFERNLKAGNVRKGR